MDKVSTPPTNHPSQPALPTQKPLSTWQKVKFIILAVFIVGIAIAWIVSSVSQGSQENDLMKNGVRAEGTATGEYLERESKGKRSTTTYYLAEYEYEANDGTESYTSGTYGEKQYDSPDDIVAGNKATVYYDPGDPGKGTYVTDEK